jgi:hypothetical protein
MLLGKTWKYQLLIKGVQALPFVVCQARVQYTFYGELYTTDTCSKVTVSPTFGEDDEPYSWVHEVRLRGFIRAHTAARCICHSAAS